MLPNLWRFVSYDAFDSLTYRLEAKPLTDNPDQSNNMQLFRRKSVSTDNIGEAKRVFIDWRKAFVICALVSSRLPSEQELHGYFNKLRACLAVAENGNLKKSDFIKVSEILVLSLVRFLNCLLLFVVDRGLV